MKYVLYMHGGSGNRGCEAIVRTTSKLLNDPKNSVLWSFNKAEDESCGIGQLYEKIVVSEEIKRFSPAYFESLYRRKIMHESDANLKIFLKNTFKDSIAVCVGGDNYCYPWSAKQAVDLNETIRKYARATILWGCSIDEESITEEVRRDLEKYSLITAREQLTYDILKTINKNTVKVSDPAFTLETIQLPLPSNFLPNNTVGINVSPMIMDYGDGATIMENYVELIRFILDSTDMNICLIPHVYWESNNDLEAIEELYNRIHEKDRVSCIKSGTAEELKGYIARCRFFVGARTHATIAAYSSCVPTLVVGYSIKSKGIARDLFGTDKNYVLPVQELKHTNDLRNHFAWLIQNEDFIRNHLNNNITEYIQNAKIDVLELLKVE